MFLVFYHRGLYGDGEVFRELPKVGFLYSPKDTEGREVGHLVTGAPVCDYGVSEWYDNVRDHTFLRLEHETTPGITVT